MNGTLALAKALSGTPLEQIDVRKIEPRFADAVRQVAGQNGRAAGILSELARAWDDSDDVLRAIFATDPNESGSSGEEHPVTAFEWPALPDSARLSEDLAA